MKQFFEDSWTGFVVAFVLGMWFSQINWHAPLILIPVGTFGYPAVAAYRRRKKGNAS